MQQRIADLEATNSRLNHLGIQVQGRLAVAQDQLAVARGVSAHVSRPKIPAPRTFAGETGAAVEE